MTGRGATAAVQMGCIYTEGSTPSETAWLLRTVVPASKRDADDYVADAKGEGSEPESTQTDADCPVGTKRF